MSTDVPLEEEMEEEASVEAENNTKLQSNEHWNEEIALGYKEYLVSGKYPDYLPKEKRRNFRKRACDFEVKDGELYYKKSGDSRLALYKSDDWLRVFQVSPLTIYSLIIALLTAVGMPY